MILCDNERFKVNPRLVCLLFMRFVPTERPLYWIFGVWLLFQDTSFMLLTGLSRMFISLLNEVIIVCTG